MRTLVFGLICHQRMREQKPCQDMIERQIKDICPKEMHVVNRSNELDNNQILQIPEIQCIQPLHNWYDTKIKSCFIFTFIYIPIHTGYLISNWTRNKFIIERKIFNLMFNQELLNNLQITQKIEAQNVVLGKISLHHH